MKTLNQIKKYVPRHIRLGVCCETPDFDAFQEIVEQIPIVDGEDCVMSQSVVKSVPAHDVMQKYKKSMFRLSARVKAGVPLNVVNINHSSSYTIDELEKICRNIDNAEAYVNQVMEERAARKSWFSDVVENDKNGSNELDELY